MAEVLGFNLEICNREKDYFCITLSITIIGILMPALFNENAP